MSEEILNTKIQWMDTKFHGKFCQSDDVHASNSKKLDKKDIKTSEEKKKLKPNDDCYILYTHNNAETGRITSFLAKQYARKIKETALKGNCLFHSVLEQISRNHHRYTASDLHRQTAFYLAKYPEIFSTQIQALLDEPLESYILNLFQGYSYGDYLA